MREGQRSGGSDFGASAERKPTDLTWRLWASWSLVDIPVSMLVNLNLWKRDLRTKQELNRVIATHRL